jgi:hypothetical protein
VFDVAGIDRIGEQPWRIDRIRNIRISVAPLADGADIMFLSSPIQDIVARPLGDALDTFAGLTLRALDLNIALLCPQSLEMKPQTAAGLPDPRLPDLGGSRACAALQSYPGSSTPCSGMRWTAFGSGLATVAGLASCFGARAALRILRVSTESGFTTNKAV